MNDYLKVLKEKFGHDNFRNKQLEIIKAVIEEKKDVCAIMFTGAGKSLCFQFPPVYSGKTAIVVSPLISLMNDQFKKMEKMGISVATLNSTVYNKDTLKKEILNGKYRLVYMTPEYLITQEEFIKTLAESGTLSLFCADESHCVSTYGNDFRPSYKKLHKLRKWCKGIPIMAMTATATKKVQEEIITSLKLKNPLIVKTTFDRPNLFIRVQQKSAKPIDDIMSVIKKDDPTIIYCQTRKMTEDISDKLESQHGMNCDIYHAGMTALERKTVHQKFIDGELKCIVATIAFGMGVDFTIRKVIHYGMPKNMESYYQEIGRAGRDGLKSECVMFYSIADMNTNNYFINQITNIPYRMSMIQLSLVMKNYIFSSECRRKYILEYFSENYTKDNCKACDNCMNKKDEIIHNFAIDANLVFETLYLTNNVYGALMIINIIRGAGLKTIPDRFKKSKCYGAGKKYPEKWWRLFLTMLINNKYIDEKSISRGNAFTLCISNKGVEWYDNYESDPNTELKLKVPEDMKVYMEIIKTKKKLSLTLKNIDDMSDDDIMDNFDEITFKKEKPKKTNNSLEKTYDLYQNQKKTINQIAITLDLNKTTIESHLVKLFEKDYPLDLERVKFNDEIYKLISKKIKELNYPDKLRDIKDNLPNHISYLQIRLSQVKMEKEKNDKKKEISDDEFVIVPGKKNKKEKSDQVLLEEYNKIIKDHNDKENKILDDYHQIMKSYKN